MASLPTAVRVAAACVLLAVGCAPAPLAPSRSLDAVAMDAAATPDAVTRDGGAGDDATTVGDAGFDAATAFELVGAPLIFAPTASSFGVSAVLRSGDPSVLRARLRDDAAADWSDAGMPT